MREIPLRPPALSTGDPPDDSDISLSAARPKVLVWSSPESLHTALVTRSGTYAQRAGHAPARTQRTRPHGVVVPSGVIAELDTAANAYGIYP
jgi:hypothetical protein